MDAKINRLIDTRWFTIKLLALPPASGSDKLKLLEGRGCKLLQGVVDYFIEVVAFY